MDTSNALAVFARREDDNAAIAVQQALPPVHIRPVGAQAITIRRDPSAILANLKQNAAAFGDEWVYSWDVNDKHSKRPDGKTTIEGPTVKLANDLARTYGNCTVEIARVEDIGTHWVFYARFVDFETGYEYTRPFQQRKAQGQGQGMQADRQQDIAFQIGASKAARNCVVNALGSYTDFALTAAKQSMIGRVEKHLADYRQKVVERLTSYGVLARVEKTWATVAKDWDVRTVAKLVAQLQAVKEGMTTIEELYPDPDAPPPGENKPRQLETFAEGATAQPTAETAPAAGKTESETKAEPPADQPEKRQRKRTPKADEVPASVAGGSTGSPANDALPADKPAAGPACPHCGRDDGQHDPACPLLSKRPDHDPETGEVTEDIPQFLKRSNDKPALVKVADEAEIRAAAAKKHPGMSKPWLDGYVARARGAAKTDVPDYAAQGLSPMSMRHWGAGWDARDMEDEDGQEFQSEGDKADGAGGQ